MSLKSRASADIVFRPGVAGLSLVLARRPNKPAVVGGAFAPISETEGQRRQGVPFAWSDFSAGLGFSRRVVPGGYAWGEGVYTRSPRLVMPAGKVTRVTLPTVGTPALGAITASAEFEGDLYLTSGPYILKLAGGTGTPVVVGLLATNPDTRYDSLQVFNGTLYAGGMIPPAIAPLARYTTAGGWEVSTDVNRRFLATVYWINTTDGVGNHVMVGTVGDSSFRYVSGDPWDINDWTPAAASPGIQVGNSQYTINSLAAAPQHVYFVKSNGIHDVDSRGYAPNLTPYWEQNFDESNGDISLVRSGEVFASHFQGLDRVNVASQIQLNVPAWVHPGSVVPNESPIYGPVVAMCQDSGWVAALFWNGSNTYLCYGRPRDELGLQLNAPSFVWHGAEWVGVGERGTHLRVTSLNGTPRLWIATLDSDNRPRLRWMSLPKASSPLQDYLNGGPWEPTEEGKLYLPAEDWGAPGASKTLLQYNLRHDQLGPSFVELFGSADGGGFFREGIATARTPITTIGGSTLLQGFDVGLLLQLTTRDGIPPLVRGVEAIASVHRKPIPVRQFTVVIGEGVDQHVGQLPYADPAEAWDQLQRLQYAGPVEMVDQRGARWLVEVQEGIEHEEHEAADNRGWSVIATFRVNFLNRIWEWESGETYDRSAVWGRAANRWTFTAERTASGVLLRWRLNDVPLGPPPNVVISVQPPGGSFGDITTIPGFEGELELPWIDLPDWPDFGDWTFHVGTPDGLTFDGLPDISDDVVVPSPTTSDGEPPDAPAATFSVTIVREQVLIAGAYTPLYTVSCINTTPGSWTSYAWTATGTGVGYTTGDQPEFVTSFSTLTGSSIQLVVANESVTSSPGINSDLAGSATLMVQELFDAETTAAGAFDGDTWRVDAPSGGNVTQVGRGPAWGTTTGVSMRSADFLATGAPETDPFTGVAITADWMETDHSATARAVGSADGDIAISDDAGATWDVKAGPSADPVLRVIRSRFTAGQVWVLTASHVYKSDDDGDNWTTIFAAAVGQTLVDLVLSHSRNVVVGYTASGGTMQKVEDGTAFALPSLDPPLARINAVAAHITQDKFFAYDNSVPPRTLITVEDGGYTMAAGETMPASVTAAPVRGMTTIGASAIPTEVAGGGGDVAWKWLNYGVGAAEGFFLIRQASTAGAGVGPFVQVAHGQLKAAAVTSDPVVVIGNRNWRGSIRSSAGVWSAFGVSLGTPEADADVWVWDVVVARDNPARLYALTANPDDADLFFWTSADGGATWTQKTEPSWGFENNYVDSPQDGHVYVGGATGIWKSADNGDSWTQIIDTSGAPVEQRIISSLHVASTKVWYALEDAPIGSQIRHANLDGSSPTSVTGGPGPTLEIHVRAFSDTVAVASEFATGGRVFLCSASAATNITPSGLDSNDFCWGAEMIDASTIVALFEHSTTGVNTIRRTVDAGANWTTVYTFPGFEGPSVTGAVDYRFIAASSQDRQFVVCAGRTEIGYQMDLLISRDGGATWTAEKNDADIEDPGSPGDFLFSGPGTLNVR